MQSYFQWALTKEGLCKFWFTVSSYKRFHDAKFRSQSARRTKHVISDFVKSQLLQRKMWYKIKGVPRAVGNGSTKAAFASPAMTIWATTHRRSGQISHSWWPIMHLLAAGTTFTLESNESGRSKTEISRLLWAIFGWVPQISDVGIHWMVQFLSRPCPPIPLSLFRTCSTLKCHGCN